MRAALGAALTVAALATACTADEEDPPPAAPDASTGVGVAWSPCDGLTAAQVGRLVGEQMIEQTGTAEEPRCTFTPAAEGGPAFDVSYLWFDGSLNEALDAMGSASARLRPATVDGADAARLAVRERASGVLVTGFVQTRGLVQSVNAVQLKPYTSAQVVAGTVGLLEALVRAAPDSPPE